MPQVRTQHYIQSNITYLLLEHVTAVTVSVKDKLTLSLGVAVGSSIVGLIVVWSLKVTNRYIANCSLRYSVWLNFFYY